RDRGCARARDVGPPDAAARDLAASVSLLAPGRRERLHLAAEGQLARLGHHRHRADEADDDRGRRRAQLALARRALRRALPGDELPALAPGAPLRSAARRPQVSVLTTLDLTKSFGDRLIFEDVSLAVDRGQALALMGPSGAGKTTFLRCLNGLELADEGEVV